MMKVIIYRMYAYLGWQSLVGVRPDLTSLGKCIAGGLAVGAVVGRADIMNMLKPKASPQQCVSHSGTWNGTPLLCSAGIAACKLYLNGEPQRRANQLGAYLRERGNQVLKERDINGRLYGRTIVHLYLGPIDYEPSDDTLPPTRDVHKLMAETPARQRLCLHLLHYGVATMDGEFFVLSAAHTEEDIDQAVKALCDSFDAMLSLKLI